MPRLPAYDRWSLLAGARFFLAAIVAVNHLIGYTELGALFLIPKLGSFEAILGFLLISGYSVTSSYVARKEGFLLRRLHRLYPVYLASLVIALLASVYVKGHAWPGPFELLANALFLNQLFTTESIVGPAWSLSLEFWLYALLPTLLNCSARTNRLLAYVSFAAYLIYTVLRTALHLPYYSGLGYGLNLVLLSFAWLCGSRLARDTQSRDIVLRDIAIMLSLHLLLAVVIQLGSRIRRGAVDQFLSVDLATYAMQAITLLAIYMLLRHVTRQGHTIERPSRTMRFLGDLSYPLYLIHIPVYITATSLGIKSPYVLLAAAMALAWLMYLGLDHYSQRREKPAVGLQTRSHAP